MFNKVINILLCFMFLPTLGIGQIPPVEQPEFEDFKQVQGGVFYTNSNLTQAKQQTMKRSVPMGAHADNIINQQYQRASQMMGTPIYRSGMTPQERQQANMRSIQQQMANDPMYQTPNQSNGFSQLALQKHESALDLINEAHTEESNRRVEMNYFNSAEFRVKTKPYQEALQHLMEQLSGQRKLSITDAYFEVESAFGNSYLSKDEYDAIIQESLDFIYKYMIQNGLDVNDNEAKHKAIQKFLGEKLTITNSFPDEISPAQKVTHHPFSYDYEDFKGEKDYRNYFLTKCLATGAGQCNSLPAVYGVLAEGIGAITYLSFAPQHSFIKYQDATGQIHSYEPTSNWNISDRWYEDHMFISPEAKRSGIYLDTLNRKQIVANSMLDLAFGYIKKHGAADGKFVKDCINASMQQFPRKNNIHAYFVYSSLLARQLERVLYKNNVTDLKDIDKIPEATKLYQALLKNEGIIKKLGYQYPPDQLYEQLMKEHEFKGKAQQEKGVSGKQRRSLFETSLN